MANYDSQDKTSDSFDDYVLIEDEPIEITLSPAYDPPKTDSGTSDLGDL